ncbi:MAG: hypothetical protein QOD93_980 [Acetobacteraceae bacterium]|jgi:hypothetical protein|nr:hypothetical protein [Rhodopila sp.]MEA2768018.1 hypothetical protein [Acetobacteraceae bacterium]
MGNDGPHLLAMRVTIGEYFTLCVLSRGVTSGLDGCKPAVDGAGVAHPLPTHSGLSEAA